MRCSKLLGHVLTTMLLTLAVQSSGQQTSSMGAERDQKAIDVLSRVGAHLRSLQAFEVRAETTKDEVVADGQKLQLGGVVDYRVQQPDRLRADVKSDRVQREFYFHDATLTQYAPRAGYYATIKTPAAIAETLLVAYEKFDIEIPLADLFFWGTPKSGVEDIKAAALIGTGYVSGVECDHYAYRQDGADWQLWVARGAEPLPLKLVITTTDDPARPQFSAVFKWNTQAKFDDSTFQFTPPRDATKVEQVATN